MNWQQSEERYESKFEKALDDAAADGEILGKDAFAPNYGTGLRIDLRAFFQESSRAQLVLESLDPTERFVILSYFLLRKTEKQLAELVGLNECRFNQFLENLTRKIGAIVAFGNSDPEVWDKILQREGQHEMVVRSVTRDKLTKALKLTKKVRTVDLLVVFLRSKSFLKVGEHFEIYYVDLRRGLELVSERMRSCKHLPGVSVGDFIHSFIQFSSVKEEGYAGSMGRIPTMIRVSDPGVLGCNVIRMGTDEVDEVLMPRALGAIQQGG